MEVSFKLCLPRDEESVPFVRHMCRSALEQLGATEESIGDIEVAVSEACTNVLRHVVDSDDQYEVEVAVGDAECVITVVDTGGALDVDALPRSEAAMTAESGRGVHLMRALVDELNFVSESSTGTVVRLRKTLALLPTSILARLAARFPGDTHGSAPPRPAPPP